MLIIENTYQTFWTIFFIWLTGYITGYFVKVFSVPAPAPKVANSKISSAVIAAALAKKEIKNKTYDYLGRLRK